MAFVRAALSIEGVTDPLPPPVTINSPITLRLAFTNASGVAVAPSGVMLEVSRPDGVELEVPTSAMTADGTGVWLYTVLLDQASQWRFRAACTGAATADLPVTAVGSALSPALPTGPVLIDETGQLLATPDGGLLTLTRVDRAAATTDLAGLKLVGVQGDETRHITGESLIAAAGTAGTGAVIPLVEEATTAAAGAAASQVSAGQSAATAVTKADEAAISQAAAAIASDAAAVSAASANALNPAISADAGNTSLALAVVDTFGQSALELSADGKTLRLAAVTLGALLDGTLRITRADGASALDLTASGGLTAGGLTFAPIAGSDYAFAVSDADGFAPFVVLNDGTVRAGALTAAADSGGVRLSAPDGSTVIRSLPGGAASVPAAFSIGGALTATGPATLGSTTIADGTGTMYAGGTLAWGLADAGGNLSFGILTDGTVVCGPIVGASFAGSVPPQTTIGDATVATDARTDVVMAWVDNAGFIGFAIKADGTLLATGLASSGTTPTVFTADEIAERNARALAIAGQTARQYEAETQRPVFGLNHFLMYGQSLSEGQEAWPALSTTQRYDNLMLGNSVHPTSGTNTTWTPIGGAVLNPLVATVRDGASGLLDAAGQAALAPGAANLGETPVEAAVNFMRKAWLDARSLTADPNRRFLASACGVSGMTIEQLSKGASPELFNRLRTCATAAKAAATAAGLTYGVPAVLYLQGENNYDASYGGATSKAAYKTLLLQLVADIRTDIQGTIAAQTRPFAFITYQTGAGYTRDADALSVGMAQWELSEEQPNWHLACPVYPVVDKGGHLDPNGSRWIGAQLGKVLHRVLVLGQRWRPLCPVKITSRAREILVEFHVPQPPLVFDAGYVSNTATLFTNKGFTVLNSSNVAVTIASVEIVADAVVKITLAADPPAGGVTVRYAGQATYSGNGNLRDSDPTIADERYLYTAGNGQYASANIPALIDKPYPLHNWCIAFNVTATAG